jgi:hypothetical protein
LSIRGARSADRRAVGTPDKVAQASFVTTMTSGAPPELIELA